MNLFFLKVLRKMHIINNAYFASRQQKLFLFLFACLILFTSCGNEQNISQPEDNIGKILSMLNSSRIDIKNYGGENNRIVIKSTEKVTEPSWFSDSKGHGKVVESSAAKQKMTIEVKNDGQLKLAFRGIYKRIDNVSFPIWTDYSSIKIDGREILSAPVATWHDKPFRYEMPVKDGQIVEVEVETQPHQYSRAELQDTILKLDPKNAYIKQNIEKITDAIIYKEMHSSFFKKNIILLIGLFFLLVLIFLKFIISLGNFNKLFVCIFFILILIPICKISKEDKSLQENRMLAEKPKISEIWNISGDKYSEKFENWFNDHFFGRENLIQINSNLLTYNSIVENNKAIYYKTNGWMFSSGYQNPLIKIDPEKIENFIRNFSEFNKFCQNNKIKLYVLVVPSKSAIYKENILTKYTNEEKERQYLQAFQHIKSQLGNNFIFPYEELQKGKKQDFVFFKESHHWTEWGAYIGYSELIKTISQDFKDVDLYSLDNYKKFSNKLIRDDWNRNFNTGHTARLLNLDNQYVKDKILVNDYVYYDPVLPIVPDVQNIPGYRIKYYKNQNMDAKYKVFLSGFSQNENLLQFLPYSFKELKYYRLNNVQNVKNEDVNKFLKRYKKDLLEFKPDILILTISPGQLFSDLWRVD